MLKRGYWDMVVARLWAKHNFSKYAKKNRLKEGSAVFQYVFNAVIPLLPSLYQYGEYDLAISFLTPHNVVADKVNAKRKVAWIHTDYTKISVNVEKELPVWNRFDYVVSISPDVTYTFLSVFPSIRDKIVEIINGVPSAEEVEAAMKKAGCKLTAEEIGKSPDLMAKAWKYHPYMRNRLSLRRLADMIVK